MEAAEEDDEDYVSFLSCVSTPVMPIIEIVCVYSVDCDVCICHRRRKKADGRHAELREAARNAEETQLCSDTVSHTHTLQVRVT